MPKKIKKKPIADAPLQFDKDEEHGLTEMQASFVWHYTEGACGQTEAARRAGYEFPSASANKLLNGKEENLITQDIEASKKLNPQVVPELTTRLRYSVTSVDGDESQSVITNFVQNMLARDSMFLRKEMREIAPDIELSQEVEIEGESVKVNIPMTVGFFWPDTE